MLTQETAAKIWKCYREIETAKELLIDIEKQLKKNYPNKHAPILNDAFGRKQHLQLGVPSGPDSHRLFGVPPELGISVIKAHIANQTSLLYEYNESAKIELSLQPDFKDFVDTAESIKSNKTDLLSAAVQTLNDNLHLCDGDVCTLKELRDAVAKIVPDWCEEDEEDA